MKTSQPIVRTTNGFWWQYFEAKRHWQCQSEQIDKRYSKLGNTTKIVRIPFVYVISFWALFRRDDIDSFYALVLKRKQKITMKSRRCQLLTFLLIEYICSESMLSMFLLDPQYSFTSCCIVKQWLLSFIVPCAVKIIIGLLSYANRAFINV